MHARFYIGGINIRVQVNNTISWKYKTNNTNKSRGENEEWHYRSETTGKPTLTQIIVAMLVFHACPPPLSAWH